MVSLTSSYLDVCSVRHLPIASYDLVLCTALMSWLEMVYKQQLYNTPAFILRYIHPSISRSRDVSHFYTFLLLNARGKDLLCPKKLSRPAKLPVIT